MKAKDTIEGLLDYGGKRNADEALTGDYIMISDEI